MEQLRLELFGFGAVGAKQVAVTVEHVHPILLLGTNVGLKG